MKKLSTVADCASAVWAPATGIRAARARLMVAVGAPSGSLHQLAQAHPCRGTGVLRMVGPGRVGGRGIRQVLSVSPVQAIEEFVIVQCIHSSSCMNTYLCVALLRSVQGEVLVCFTSTDQSCGACCD